jgi:hypothetical protein
MVNVEQRTRLYILVTDSIYRVEAAIVTGKPAGVLAIAHKLPGVPGGPRSHPHAPLFAHPLHCCTIEIDLDITFDVGRDRRLVAQGYRGLVLDGDPCISSGLRRDG